MINPPRDLDPRWEWVDVTTFDGKPTWIKGRCNHLLSERTSVLDGDSILDRCVTCGHILRVL